MQIQQLRVFILKLTHEEPYLGSLPDPPVAEAGDGYVVRAPWRSLYSPRFETMLVQVTAEDGSCGWGEALAPVAPEVPAMVASRLLRPALVGSRVTGPRPTWCRLRDLMRERGHLVGHQADALAAVDIALWDLVGRRLGVPVADLLGGRFRAEVPTYVSGLPRTTDEQRAALAKHWADRGVRRIKLHLGHGVEADLATVDAVLEAHPELRIAVDAHWAYAPAEAARLGRELARRRALFLEAPIAPEDVEGHRDLAQRLDLPIASGEALRNRYEFELWLSRRALGLAQPDIARTGITETMAIAELAETHHVPVAPHHSVGLGVALAAGLHTAAAIERMPFFEYQPTTVDIANKILDASLHLTPTTFRLPDTPGLGVDVDMDTVTAHAEEI